MNEWMNEWVYRLIQDLSCIRDCELGKGDEEKRNVDDCLKR